MRLAIPAIALTSGLCALALEPFAANAAAPTRTSWANAANAICVRENVEIRALPKVVHPNTIAGTAHELKETLPLAIATEAQIGKILRPLDEAAAISTFLGGAEREISFARTTLLPALNRGQLPTSVAKRFDVLDSQNNAAARKLGAPACASSS